MEKLNQEGDVAHEKLRAMLRTPLSASGDASGDGDPGADNGRKPISISRMY